MEPWICAKCAAAFDGIASASRHAEVTRHEVMRKTVADELAKRPKPKVVKQ